MALFDTEAIVINNLNMGEADLMVTLFTRDYGKIRAVAPGARVLRSRYTGFFQLLSVLRVIYFGNERQEFYRIKSCDMVRASDLTRHLSRILIAHCMAEVLELACGPSEVNREIYDLTLEGVRLLNGGNDGLNLPLRFAAKVSSLSGYKPHLEDCVSCRGELMGKGVKFSPAKGGALCGRCVTDKGENYPMSMGSLNYIRAILGLDLRKGGRIRLDSNLRREVQQIVFNHLTFYGGKKMKTVRFLEL